jgi:Transposase, Mutator family
LPAQLSKCPATQGMRGSGCGSGCGVSLTDGLPSIDAFAETYGAKYDQAVECLTKDRDALLAFYDFPAEHWKHLRTIESTFATVRHRTIRSKGCLSNKTALAMVFKLVEGAQKSWRRLDGHNQLPKLIGGGSSPTESRLPRNRLHLKPKPPPDPSGRQQDSAIAQADRPSSTKSSLRECIF